MSSHSQSIFTIKVSSAPKSDSFKDRGSANLGGRAKGQATEDDDAVNQFLEKRMNVDIPMAACLSSYTGLLAPFDDTSVSVGT